MLLFVIGSVTYAALTGGGGEDGPSSAEVIKAFEDAGLTVVDPRPVEKGDLGKAPQTFEEGTHFVASTEEDLGAKVFTYESVGEMRKMKDFYEGFSGFLSSHVYTKDLVLLQIHGRLPKAEADRYGEVLEGV